ncbi:uncharacterized protein PV09_03920 [Verruconis gallopava]|uniref:Ras-GEF domain-containing protein n=1 Tax=Verruconis gallopava TaxID=253628 RepID=A0A0D1YXH5_9PEZI|nr:uncharacterized protein PV09_03920 [Verruconis gallopava]KIW05407.1 hypothetical protein PV09_03920 [Verruconis gallopava]
MRGFAAPLDLRRDALGRVEEEEPEPMSAYSETTNISWGESVSSATLGRTTSRGRPRRTGHVRQSSSKTQRSVETNRSNLQISPPLTPKREMESATTFHNYLRAFYHFHPSSTVSSSTDESSITVPINQGDVILVHSIHPNGWADGTLLVSGARGWLPTNYCEAYDPQFLRNLLNALTHLWNLVRNGENDNLEAFTRQDYVRGMIAGVRYFLEQTDCLSRDSPLILNHVGLRRLRKGLLGDLSSLVKIAKELQANLQPDGLTTSVYELLDELVLKAFKVVIRAVRFLDVWSQDVAPEQASDTIDFADPNNRLPTPPVDTSEQGERSDNVQPREHALSHEEVTGASVQDAVSPVDQTPKEELIGTTDTSPRSRAYPLQAQISASSPTSSTTNLVPRPLSLHSKRLSVSHRMSYGGSGASTRHNLASVRLNEAHDSFLGLLATFIGSHLQSRSSQELTSTTQQAVAACRQLLAIVEEVWARDGQRSAQLADARDIMYTRLAELVQATRDMFSQINGDEPHVLDTDRNAQLVSTSTNCIRAAGECVTKARNCIERIGDFEFESVGLGLMDDVFQTLEQFQVHHVETTEVRHVHVPSQDASQGAEMDVIAMYAQKPLPEPPQPTPSAPGVDSESKPLPEPPQSPTREAPLPPEPQSPVCQQNEPVLADSPPPPSIRSLRASSPRLSQLQVPSSQVHVDISPNSATSSFNSQEAPASRFYGRATRADSVNTSAADTSSSWRNSSHIGNGSEVSLASTRATTPDGSPVQPAGEYPQMTGSFGSMSELQTTVNDEAALEEAVLEKTYAHELVYNKEGQITGGSLPALVEKLTTHDTTPDAVFTTTFYLTFRLFTTPYEFARCLIDRFEYIGSSPVAGVPVRLRVYNVFKGWLESHWQCDTDAEALGLINDFARGPLVAALPAAGKRLAELAARVADMRDGTLVPRMVSSLGKTSTSVTVHSNEVAPAPLITKSQLALLRNPKSQCSITDFDPLEIARQMTLIESKLFCSIRPEELLGLEWTKKHDSRAVNVRAMSTLSTDLTNLVADTILQHEEPKKRALIIKQWVKICVKCLELANYDTLMAIVCSLNSSMVLRLKKTWDLVSAKTKARLDELKTIVDVSKNYAVLRQRLQNHVAPCIPFVGIYLTDLTFVDVGNQTTRQLPGADGPDGQGKSVINFDKHTKTAKIIGQLQGFQVPYKLQPVPEMQEWMESQIQRVRNSEQANVQTFYRRSLLLEPRETNQQSITVPAIPSAPASAINTARNSPVEGSSHASKESVSTLAPQGKFDLWGSLHLGSSKSST